jgi:hypothetical protein
MGDERDKIVTTDYVIESIKAEIEAAEPSRRRRISEAIALAALGGIPWVGGVISAAAAFKAGESEMPAKRAPSGMAAGTSGETSRTALHASTIGHET